jgi:hypothetical protein
VVGDEIYFYSHTVWVFYVAFGCSMINGMGTTAGDALCCLGLIDDENYMMIVGDALCCLGLNE